MWPVLLCLATATPAPAQMAAEAQPSRVREAAGYRAAGYRAGGELLVVEGRGTQQANGETRVVHDAFGAISYDAATASYRMRSYRAGQGWVDAVVVVDGQRVQWELESPAGPIRFTADFSEPARWIETGEIQRDAGLTV